MIYSQIKYHNDLYVLCLFNIVQLHIFINTIKKTLICLFWYLQDYRSDVNYLINLFKSAIFDSEKERYFDISQE